jgi:hypothetical protein
VSRARKRICWPDTTTFVLKGNTQAFSEKIKLLLSLDLNIILNTTTFEKEYLRVMLLVMAKKKKSDVSDSKSIDYKPNTIFHPLIPLPC